MKTYFSFWHHPLQRISADSSEVENLEKVSTNAYKMYLRSRPVASTESSKRLKDLNLATTTILPHPMILGGEDEDRKSAQVGGDIGLWEVKF